MKKVAWSVGLCFFLYFCVALTQTALSGQPKLLIPETTFDFGYAPTKCVLSHYYLVKNVGTDTLKIQTIKPA